jgi:hypothetical protein
MYATASHGGTDLQGVQFSMNDSTTLIRLNWRYGIVNVDFNGISRLQFIGMDLQLEGPSQGKV